MWNKANGSHKMDLVKVIEEARQGNKEAFGLLYSAYRLKMKGVCIKILKEEKDDVDDICHNALPVEM